MPEQTTTTWVDNIFVFTGILVLVVIAQLYIQIFLAHSYEVFTTEEEIEEVKAEHFPIIGDYL